MLRMSQCLQLLKQEIEAQLLELLRRQLRYVSEKVPFYQKLFQEKSLHPEGFKTLEDLRHLPILTKEIVRKNTPDFMAQGFSKTNCYKSHSSGATGEPFYSYFDRLTWMRKKYFSKFRAHHACGLKFGEKIALFEAETDEKLQVRNRKSQLLFSPYRVQFFSIFSLA